MKLTNQILPTGIISGVCLLTLISTAAPPTDGDEIELHRQARGIAKPIPIALSGFSGEVASVLGYDLFVCGFEVVAAEAAQYSVNGSNDGQVKGELRDMISKQGLFNNRYSGGTLRT